MSPSATKPCKADVAEASCAGPTETCFEDTRCSGVDGPDPFGGLGCNAGGVAWNCRFCGFGGFNDITCPGAEVEIDITIATDIAIFNQTEFKVRLRYLVASEVSFTPSIGDIDLVEVTGGSVEILARVRTPSVDLAVQLAEGLDAASVAALSAVLQVQVDAKNWVSARMRGVRVSLTQLRQRLGDLDRQQQGFVALCAIGMVLSLCCLVAGLCVVTNGLNGQAGKPGQRFDASVRA